MILLADELVEGSTKKGGQQQIGGMAIRVVRNQFGRQVDSFEHALEGPLDDDADQPFTAVFIRAPVVHTILSSDVEVLASVPVVPAPEASTALIPLGPDASAVALRQGKIMVTSFHPEITKDTRLHRYWLTQVVLAP